MDPMRGSSPTKSLASDSPEHLINAFKAAALSVTKLYKTSAAAQAKARSEGYQDCLDDLLTFLDKQHIGLCDGEGWQIRKWATERLDGRVTEDEDEIDKVEVDKTEVVSSPEITRSNTVSHPSPLRNDSVPPPISHAPVVESVAEEPTQMNTVPTQINTVPTQDTFTFQSSVPYPQESYLNLANLDLSDSMRTSDNTTQTTQSTSTTQASQRHRSRRHPRPRNATTSGHLGKGAGSKRSLNYAELFDVGGLNFGKDMFGREGKRSRHT